MSRRGSALHIPLETRVEQMLAWGRSYSYIRRVLGVDDYFIDAVIVAQNAAVADDPPFMLAGAG